jgi:hypothetical protein
MAASRGFSYAIAALAASMRNAIGLCCILVNCHQESVRVALERICPNHSSNFLGKFGLGALTLRCPLVRRAALPPPVFEVPLIRAILLHSTVEIAIRSSASLVTAQSCAL